MPRKLPPNVERNFVKGKSYYSYRVGKGARTRLPDLDSPDFGTAYAAAMVADLLLLPCGPSPLDLFALKEALALALTILNLVLKIIS